MTWDYARHVEVFNRAVGSRDWSGLVALFSEVATMEFVGPPVPPIVGRDAIWASYAADGPAETIELIGPVTREGDEDVVPFRWRESGDTGSMRATARGDHLDRLVVLFDPPGS